MQVSVNIKVGGPTFKHGYKLGTSAQYYNWGRFSAAKMSFALIIHLRAEKYISDKCYICAHVFVPLPWHAAGILYHRL